MSKPPRMSGARTRVAKGVELAEGARAEQAETKSVAIGRAEVQQAAAIAGWEGRDLFDAYGDKIGSIAGLGFRRARFGTLWLLVRAEGAGETGAALVPAAQVSEREGRLVLPYPRSYVEDAPAIEPGQRFPRSEERRLLFHYGLDSQLPDGGCPQRCGLCGSSRRPVEEH